MRKQFKNFLWIFISLGMLLLGLGSPNLSMAQSVSLNFPIFEDYMRRQQLLGELDSGVSFMIRPLYPGQAFGKDNGVDLDGTFTDEDLSEFSFSSKDGKGSFMMMPGMLRTQYNSNYAFGINNGPMIPNAGMQVMASVGVFAEYGGFSFQIQPEFLYAANRDYMGFPLEHDPSTWAQYYDWLNTIDRPERFGDRAYTKMLMGQSSIRYNYREWSIGISTENLWWGPGRRGSLLMSNHAPGFLHATINTRKPVATPIGKFETQLIAGRLEASGFDPPNTEVTFRTTPPYAPKRDAADWRYLAGFVMSYQPTWVPGLFLGFSSVSQMYSSDMETFSDYLPMFNSEKGPQAITRPAVDRRNQMSSGFFRWISPEGHFEFYGEYGSNGNSRTMYDFLINPDLNRAFTFGFSHLIKLKKQREFIQVGMEMTQTGQTVRENILARNSWYTHPHVRHGYTHRGQVLGFGYGPGSNVISADIAWVKDFNRIGFQLEYINHNNDFYYKRFEEIKDWRVKYVDIVPTILGEWRFDQVLIFAHLQYVNTLNYHWYIENDPSNYFVPGLDKNNLVAKFGATYVFK